MEHFPFCRLFAVSALFFALVLNVSAKQEKDTTLSASDTATVRTVLERYRTAWLANDAAGVRSTFAKDAVLMPHHGLDPVVGMAAINEFWWPVNAANTTTTITRFIQTTDEVGGSGTLAYVRGRSQVDWSVADKSGTQNWHTGGNFLALLKKQPDGRWLISHLMWDDPPNQLLK